MKRSVGVGARRTIGLACLLLVGGCDRGPRVAGLPPPPPPSPFAPADSLRDEGLWSEALDAYRALRDSLLASPDTAALWKSQLWLSEALMRSGASDSARAGLERARALAGSSVARQGWTGVVRCGLLSRLGESDAAVAECTRVLELARSAGDRELEARAHFQLGTIHSRRGRFRESVPATERALALERRYGRSRHRLAGTLNSMGIEYSAVGRLGEAERMYREGLDLARRFRSPWYAFHLNSNLAYLRASVGDLAGALELMTESLRGAEQLADTQGIVYAHNSLSEFYLRTGNHALAHRHLESALAMNQRVSAIYRVITLENLGRLEAARSAPRAAEATLLRALEAAEASDFDLQRVRILAQLARLAIQRADPGTAGRLAQEAVALADSLGSPEAELEALQAHAAVLEAQGNAGAPDAYLQAVSLLESWRGRLALGDLRMGVADPHWSVYEGAVRTLLRQGRAAAAFEVAERARARLLLELLAERDASRATASREQALRRALRALYQERTAVGDPTDQADLDREIAAVADSLAALEREARRTDPAAGAARYPRPIAAGVVQARLLGPQRALLAYFWGDRDVYGWWLTGDSVRAARLGSADSLRSLVEFVRGALEDPSQGSLWTASAHRAYRTLVEPLAPSAAPEVLVVPDGPLAYVPLEILLPAPGALPWGGTRRIAYGPSASVLANLAGAPARAQWERAALVVGNPAPRAADPGTVAELPPLPHAEREASAVYRLFRGKGADLLLGRRATLAQWLSLSPDRYRYLHFAAHALVSERDPEQTHLVLASGRLDLAAIRRLALRAELVTLSACETALGRRVRGEGVIGLPHAFLAAGARGAAVSLWRIEDRFSADFMDAFYRELRRGRSPADALFVVRRRLLLEQGAAGHPSRWAAFVLVGAIGPPASPARAPLTPRTSAPAPPSRSAPAPGER